MPLALVTERKLQRRSAVRYNLQLPVIFHWTDTGEHTAGGFTGNVAVNGALIHSTVCPPVGCDIRIEVLIPSPDLRREQLHVQCQGQVTRSSGHGGSACIFCVRGFFDDENITRQMVT